MKSPAFWEKPNSLMSRLLAPLGSVYAGITAWRLSHAQPWRAPVPVLCIGNLTAGGAGKTPIVRDLAQRLALQGSRPAILSRGYGGRERGPLKVDAARHKASQVGDEPLLLARDAACWIAADRAAGARAAVADGAGIILMDDGLQNPDLTQDVKIIVVDGAAGFGNGRAIPAGPLRERVESGISRADAVIILGEDRCGLIKHFADRIAILRASVGISDTVGLAGRALVAFAGIGRPAKFEVSLRDAGVRLLAFQGFADHHPFSDAELNALAGLAAAQGADLVTTEKDWVRLPAEWREKIEAIPVSVSWRDESALAALFAKATRNG